MFAEGGAFGELLAGVDWAATPLGPAETWPAPLVDTLSFMLASEQGMLLLWGPEAAVLYNASHMLYVGGKHPWALGRPSREVYAEIWEHHASPNFHHVVSTRKPLLIRDELSILDRHGFLEQCYFDVAFQPVPLEDGTVGGALGFITETTGRVLGERRLRLLSELGTRTAGLPTPGEVARVVAQVADGYREEVPFMGLYLAGEPGVLRLAATTGLPDQPEPAYETIPLEAAGGADIPALLARAVTEGTAVVLPAVPFACGSTPGQHTGSGRIAVEQAWALPLRGTGEVEGVLVVGVNPTFPPAGAYHAFLEVFAAAVAGALAAALAHEEHRRRAEELAELDRAKTAFFSNVSHEFRTPLTLLLGPLQEALAEEDRPQRRDRLELAERAALRLLKLVNTLLDVTRADAGRLHAVFEPVDLAHATAELASIFRSAFDAAHLTLEVACPPLPQPVYADREMWEKIILNLLSNALKFTFTGGVRVEVAAAGSRVRLTVADTGAGIPEHELPHLFERFHQVRGARCPLPRGQRHRSGAGEGPGGAARRQYRAGQQARSGHHRHRGAPLRHRPPAPPAPARPPGSARRPAP